MEHHHSAGGVVINDDKVLTISWTDRNYVCFPKGHLEEGETSEQAAVREVLEETGYKVKIIDTLMGSTYEYEENGVRHSKVVDYYLMKLVDQRALSTAREDGENFENVWMGFEDALSRLTFDDARSILREAVGKHKETK